MANTQVGRVVILGTGGTIAGLAKSAHDSVGYVAAQVGVEQLLDSISTPEGYPYDVVTEQIAQIDGKDMAFGVWQRLAQRAQELLATPDVRGLVITHGTDTLEETAYFLHAVVGRSHARTKPVVLTGAMRPASAVMPDGPQNMLDALTLVACPGSSGVMVVFAGAVHAALDVQKVHNYRLNAFDSGDAGPIGYIESGRLRLEHGWPRPEAVDSGCDFLLPIGRARWPRVEIVTSHAGAGACIVDSLLLHGQKTGDPLCGIAVAGTGNGTVHHDLEAALMRAQSIGVRVVRASRCAGGRVLAGADDAIPDSMGLSVVKARIALMLKLMQPEVAAQAHGSDA